MAALKSWNFLSGDYQTWLRNLKDWPAEYLVVDESTWEHQWATQHPELFQQLFAHERLYIYQIKWPTATESTEMLD